MTTMNRAWTLQHRSLPAARATGLWLIVVGAALVSGALVAGKIPALLGDKSTLLLLAALVGGAFLIVFAFLGSASVLIWPVAATGGYLLAFPQGNPLVTFDRLWIAGLITYIALTPRVAARSPSTRFLRSALLLFATAYGIRTLTTHATDNQPMYGWVDAVLLPTILFFACERYCQLGTSRLRRLAGALMLAGGVLGGVGIAERIFGFQLASLTRGGAVRFDANIDATRISGPYPVPEPYALTLIICFAATLYWILSRERGRPIWFGVVLAAIQVAGIALALFRAGWIAALLVLVTTFGVRPGRFGRLFAVGGIACVVAFIGTAQLQQNRTVSERVNNTENIYTRLATYEQGLEIFRASPLFGVGVDRYHEVAQRRPPVVVSHAPSVPYPHSSYVGILAEQGFFGFVPFLVLSFAVWRLLVGLRVASLRERRAALVLATAAGATLGYLIMSLTLTMLPYEPSNAFFAAFLGGASGYLDAVENEIRTKGV